MSQGIVMEEEEGGCLAIPVRLVVEGGLILGGALGGVKGCSHLGNRAPLNELPLRLRELAMPGKLLAARGRPASFTRLERAP
jgi:hypothetical protein